MKYRYVNVNGAYVGFYRLANDCYDHKSRQDLNRSPIGEGDSIDDVDELQDCLASDVLSRSQIVPNFLLIPNTLEKSSGLRLCINLY